MTRSEERLVVDTERVARTRARLVKYVVTEEVQITVPIRREEIRVEGADRRAGPGGESLTEDGRQETAGTSAGTAAGVSGLPDEIILHTERPVVTSRSCRSSRCGCAPRSCRSGRPSRCSASRSWSTRRRRPGQPQVGDQPRLLGERGLHAVEELGVSGTALRRELDLEAMVGDRHQPVTCVATFHWIGLPLATDVAGAQGREPRIAAPVDCRGAPGRSRPAHHLDGDAACRCSRIVRRADWAVQRAGRPERSNLISVPSSRGAVEMTPVLGLAGEVRRRPGSRTARCPRRR